jgi:two-component system LytT family response regulator
MNKLRTIIVDDESLARRGLKLRLEQYPELELVAQCCNGKEALGAVAELQPDLMFLDIQMPGMDGFEVVGRLQADTMPLVVFVTAFDQYAVDAFNIHAIDYVLKPIDDERLQEAVTHAIDHFNKKKLEAHKQNLIEVVLGITGASEASIEEMAEAGGNVGSYPDKLSIKDGDEVQMVPTADIEWVDAAGDYMCVHAAGVTHIMRITMKQLESLLNPAVFLRVHRSTIVNANRISRAQSLTNGEFLLTLDNDSQLKVSRSYRDKIKHLLAN